MEASETRQANWKRHGAAVGNRVGKMELSKEKGYGFHRNPLIFFGVPKGV